MRNTLVTMLTASILVAAAVVGMPSSAQSQVIIIVGNGQPYYPPPYPHPYPYDRHVVFGGYYSGYGYYPHPYPYPYQSSPVAITPSTAIPMARPTSLIEPWCSAGEIQFD